jgi:hypothetical protein
LEFSWEIVTPVKLVVNVLVPFGPIENVPEDKVLMISIFVPRIVPARTERPLVEVPSNNSVILLPPAKYSCAEALAAATALSANTARTPSRMMRGFSILFVPFRLLAAPRRGWRAWCVLPVAVRHRGGAPPCRAAFRATGRARLVSWALARESVQLPVAGRQARAFGDRVRGVGCGWWCCGEVAAAARFSVFGVSGGAIGDTGGDVRAPAGGAGRRGGVGAVKNTSGVRTVAGARMTLSAPKSCWAVGFVC